MVGFTKLFSSIVHSTVWREKDHVRLVWITMLALSDKNGNVEASIPGLADAARVTIKECEDALNRFQQPDKYSRSIEHEGRRVKPVDGGWLLLNYEKYRGKLVAEKKREQNAERQRRFRAKENNAPVTAGNVTVTRNAQSEAESYAYAESESEEKNKRGKTKRFAPPSLDELKQYCTKQNYNLDAEQFINFYEAKGWMIGKNKMKSWQAAVRTWAKRDNNKQAAPQRETAQEAHRRRSLKILEDFDDIK